MAPSKLPLVYLAHLKISLPFLKKGRGLFRKRNACAPPLGAVPLPFRKRICEVFLSLCRSYGSARMPRNRSEMPRRAFVSCLAALRTVSRVSALESNRWNGMVRMRFIGLLFIRRKVIRGFFVRECGMLDWRLRGRLRFRGVASGPR